MNSIKENTSTLERFLGHDIRVRLKSPSGKEITLPIDTLIYKEQTNEEKEGFYLFNLNYRLKPSQLINTSITFTKKGKPCLLLSFDLGKYVMEHLSYESIKHKLLFSTN